MNHSSSTSFDWLNHADPALLQLDDIPLLGYPPSFPWGEYSKKISELFQIESLKVEPGEMRWRSQDELYENLGEHLQPVNLSASPFSGEIVWVIAKEDIAYLMSAILTKQSSPPLQEIQSDFQKGFYRFMAIEAMNILYQVDFDHTITPHILDKEELIEGAALSLDIKISLFDRVFWGRILISPEFRKSWKEHYTEKKLNSASANSLSQKTTVNIHIVSGKVRMNHSEWKKVSLGDFLILDRCTIDPDSMKGTVYMILKDGTVVFEAKLNRGCLKILGIPQFQEDENAMDKNENQEDIEEEFSEENEEVEEEALEEPESEEEEEMEEEESEEEIEEPEGEEKLEEEVQHPPFEEAPVSPNEIPITVTVEIGRMQMTMQKLLDLQPGNLLDLNLQPENGVNLVVNGKCVGKGELLRVGKTIGVRILDIG